MAITAVSNINFEPESADIGRPALPPGRFVDLPGRGTTFVREAAGPPDAPTVFLLHGWTVTGALNWFPVYQPLSELAHVVSIDHRGHGQGMRTRRRFSLEACADDVAALADELGVERFVVAGYSMGGPIAQLVWHRHRERVAGIVLCSTFARSSINRRERTLLRTVGSVGRASRLLSRRRQLDLLTRGTIASGGSSASDYPPWVAAEVRSGSVPMMLEAGGAIARFDSRSWVGGIDVPIGVLVSQQDAVVASDRQHRLAALLPQARLGFTPLDHADCVNQPDLFVPPFLDMVRYAAGISSDNDSNA